MQDEVTVTQAEELFDAIYSDMASYAEWGIPSYREASLQTINEAFARHRHQAERETLARMEWRDIESAPKDGTRFLAWCPYVGRVIMRIDGVHRETWAIDPSGRLGCNPTKWMPLPPAPEAGQ